jgi:methionyl-tRNA formyltransferase
MNILFIGYKENQLIDFLKKENFVVVTADKVNVDFVKQFDYVISYGYLHIIKKDVIDACKNGIINLHIAYLPYNRGFHPNFWSFIEGTPKGVTIHFIDEGVDTGDILFQKEVVFNSDEDTLEKTYDRLRKEMEILFMQNWDNIINKNYHIKIQPEIGTFHYKKNIDKYWDSMPDGWGTKIEDVINMNKRSDLEIIDEVEKVRTKNNVNWMDILRLAFKHAPSDARKLMGKVNKYDSKISKLLTELSENE